MTNECDHKWVSAGGDSYHNTTTGELYVSHDFYCKKCRALKTEGDPIREILLGDVDVRGYSLATRLQFSTEGREIIEQVKQALGGHDGN